MPLVHSRSTLTLSVAGLLLLAMAAAGPILQPAGYHHFADQRLLLGIPNGADVLSNLGFLLAALAGLLHWKAMPSDQPGRNALGVFALALGMTAFGSAWYHLAPDDARLVWDRIPIALACGALLAGALRQAHPGSRAALPLLLAAGIASVFWWKASGDLRPYLLIQLAPLVLIPLLQWQARAPLAQRKAFGLAIVLYVLAKLCELGDLALFEMWELTSGHTLKHLLAVAAALVLVRPVAWGTGR